MNAAYLDVKVAEAIVLEAGPKSSTFLDIFRAYNLVLGRRGLDPADDVESVEVTSPF